ncbi:metal ABC transporter substrate-binding protein [Variovorax guangxiensis]|uniref:metal ABC transporter substrate-binding protein n=1 Tax=Variovorax guangxiensis TaxID=1775474 RepID=UPI0028672671|nr:metal ABC transporter substrate-binding protein [Variovorax guangxiensis]MDR6860992.1 ABC-type Zn uptake system ZnuABC Zn-binding protein ZnuA [Variovorax guangxiensis]
MGALATVGVRAAELPPANVCTSRMRVVAATSDLASLVDSVGGDLVQVRTMAPPMADPESFEPRASDLALIANAALVVRVGLGYDHWLEKLLDRPGRGFLSAPGSVVDASSGIPLLEVVGRNPFAQDNHGHGIANPHYWLDPANVETMTATIAEAIASVSSLARETVLENRQRFLKQLRLKMHAWAHLLAPCRGAAVLAYHNSWPYFARRFRLNVVGFIEPREGVTPSVAHLASLLTQARRTEVRAILQTTNEPKQFSETVAARLGIPLIHLAPAVGSVPETEDYLRLMDYNVSALARVLVAKR